MKISRVGIVLGLVVGACGGDSGDGAGAAKVETLDQFFAEEAKVFCAQLTMCCADTQSPVDEAKCREVVLAQGRAAKDAVAAGEAEFSVNAANDCLAAMRDASSCEQSGPESCNRAVAGTKKPGAACKKDEECAPPEAGDVSCEEQQCRQRLRAEAGDDCHQTCTEARSGAVTSTSCTGTAFEREEGAVLGLCFKNDGLYCNAGTGTCRALEEAGQRCSGEECGEGLYCNSNGKCHATLEVGAMCDSFDGCANGYCSSEDDACHAFVASGGKCDPASFEQVCADGGYCNEDGKCESLDWFGDGDDALEFVCSLFGEVVGS